MASIAVGEADDGDTDSSRATEGRQRAVAGRTRRRPLGPLLLGDADDGAEHDDDGLVVGWGLGAVARDCDARMEDGFQAANGTWPIAEREGADDGEDAEELATEGTSFEDEEEDCGTQDTAGPLPDMRRNSSGLGNEEGMMRKASSRRAELDLDANRALEELRAALRKDSEDRTPEDIVLIFERALTGAQDMFLQSLTEPVRRFICERLVLEETLTNDVIIDFGEIGDKLYLVISGRVRVDIPHGPSGVGGAMMGDLVPLVFLDPGRVFGERALFTDDCKRNARVTAVEPSSLVTLSKEDYEWCVARANEAGDREVDRVLFLQTLDRANLGFLDVQDLQVFAGLMKEQSYMGRTTIVKQGDEVDRVILIKSGFCSVVRDLQPRYREAFHRFADKRSRPPNPFARDDLELAPESSGGEAGQSHWSLREGESETDAGPVVGVGLRAALSRMMPDFAEQLRDLPPTPRERKLTRGVGGRTFRRTATSSSAAAAVVTSRKTGDLAEESTDTQTASLASNEEVVIVDHLQAGRSFGTTELFEGVTYQYSLVADPCATVYIISKYDLVRNTPKTILHRMFIDYKMRLTDERLIQRMKQMQHWNNYKSDLLDDIQQRRTRSKYSAVDRRAPPPRRAGVGQMSTDDYCRIGAGEGIWHGRASTPPVPTYSAKDSFDILHITCHVNDEGRKDLTLVRERRDASLVALDERIVMMTATARKRDRLRLTQRQPTFKGGSSEAPGASTRCQDTDVDDSGAGGSGGALSSPRTLGGAKASASTPRSPGSAQASVPTAARAVGVRSTGRGSLTGSVAAPPAVSPPAATPRAGGEGVAAARSRRTVRMVATGSLGDGGGSGGRTVRVVSHDQVSSDPKDSDHAVATSPALAGQSASARGRPPPRPPGRSALAQAAIAQMSSARGAHVGR